ncbi:MAG: glutamate-5-semialdehyde dehydrogenase [Clostridia bacterium]|nr:glutamate-5-semialdehyde dehydrogenase [Clostridia bacterium]
MFDLENACKTAKAAARTLVSVPEEKINAALVAAADRIEKDAEYIKKENLKDVEFARGKGYPDPFIDRLLITDSVLKSMADGIRKVADLKSPVGETVYSYYNKEQGVSIDKINVPFGLIGIIYEARPNVTADAFALCFKTRNAVVLKGGKEAINSNLAVVKSIKKALMLSGIDENVVSVVENTDRETTLAFMKMNKYLDLLIPRGSASLIGSALENATVPIIETGTGNCHIYIDKTADESAAADIVFNAKTQRYGVCNACESLVINGGALDILPAVAERLKEKQVEIRADERSFAVLKGYPYLAKATEEDFYTEFLAPIISVKTVDALDEAIEFINEHSTHHSESIITKDEKNAEKFLREIDSACVYKNASTRFSDGFVFGLGAEIGISTQKLHARGPMGLDALVTTKYVVNGDGAVRK